MERKRTGLGTKPTLCMEYAGMKSERLIKVWFLLNDLETWRTKIHSMILIEISDEEIGRIVEKLDPPSKKILEYLRLQGHARIDGLAELIEAPTHMDVLLKIKRNINPTVIRGHASATTATYAEKLGVKGGGISMSIIGTLGIDSPKRKLKPQYPKNPCHGT